MIRSAQTESGSPIETQTSVWTKSTPPTASFGSSVSVTFPPEAAASSLAFATSSSTGQRCFGAPSRTSIFSVFSDARSNL